MASFPSTNNVNAHSDIKNYAGDAHLLKFTAAHIGPNNESGYSVEFLAFITSFNQNFTSTWNSENVYGRNDPIGTFQGTQRIINLSWDIPSQDLNEAKSNLQKFSALTMMLYPTYTSGREKGAAVAEDDGGIEEDGSINLGTISMGPTISSNALSISKSPLIRLKYANLIADSSGQTSDGLLGWINSVSWTPVIDMGMFQDTDGIYPKVVSLTVDFSVTHEHPLGHIKDGESYVPMAPKFPLKD